jgi:hypothetical protein
MCLPRIELAPLTGAYDLGGIGHSSWPVEALLEGVPDQCSRRCVVDTSPKVYFLKQLVGMQRCRIPEALRLYSSLSRSTNDLARRASHRACV